MDAEHILFMVFAACTLASCAGVIVLRNPIASAMSLVACFFFLAGIYVLLWAHTIAALQVLVYAGAIMVLFLFVIMLLSLQDTGPVVKISLSRILGALSVVGLFGGLAWALSKLPQGSNPPAWTSNQAAVSQFGTISAVGQVMYTQWLFPFEVVSLLLLVAILGAVVVAKPRI
ncbi:MAG: NADH-quinone oxidoreductase subunit J [Myxococcaceae bacterium]